MVNSGVRVSDITNFIEVDAPTYLAEPWDNVGLMVGNDDVYVNSVLVCLDISCETINEALKKNCQLIITHHPFIFHPLKAINAKDYKGKLAIKLISNSISVYSAHTNLDYAQDGVNDCLAKALKLKDVEILKVNPKKYQDKFGNYYGLGRIGVLEEEMDILEFCNYVKNCLGTNGLRYAGKGKNKFRKVCVYGGSFDFGDLDLVLASGCDALVTGDLKYSQIMEYKEQGIYFVDAGHYSTERVYVKRLTDKLRNRFPNVEFYESVEEYDPFIYV